jgi:phage tail sheath protein FI
VPEYLAPGVYVEETSFRAKSIEGVSTSTTAFVGPTRKGPVSGISGTTPELITSFGDFVRIYGGLDNLQFGTNYLAHSVLHYFNEGGARLYVSRVTSNGPTSGRAVVNVVGSDANALERARFIARFPGQAGNGRITVRQIHVPATRNTMDKAPEGTLLRAGSASPAGPARITAGTPTFSVPNNGVLRLAVAGGAPIDIVFRGVGTEAVAAAELPDPPAQIAIDAANRNFRVILDGAEQVVTLPTGNIEREDLVIAINRGLRGGYARLTEAGDAPTPPNRLVIGSDRQGRLSSVTIPVAAFGFTAGTTATGAANANNNVSDLSRVTAGEVNDLLAAATAGLPAARRLSAVSAPGGPMIISTQGTGNAITLGVQDATAADTVSVHDRLGLVAGSPPATGTEGTALVAFVKVGNNWQDSGGAAIGMPPGTNPGDPPTGGGDFIILTVEATDMDGNVMIYDDLGFDARHPRYVGSVLSMTPARRSDFLDNFFALDAGRDVSAYELYAGLFPGGQDEVELRPTGGSDGGEPVLGAPTQPGTYAAALDELQGLEDISIIAAPGHSDYSSYEAIQGALIAHAERPRAYRIAVLDTRRELTPTGARTERSRIDSKYAALYFPWVTVANPLARPGVETIPREITLPPSGFICGIYARNDSERGVFKAPANEVVRDALRFESDVNFAQNQFLNPLGVNCLRYFPGRGYRVWGGRTISSDPEWKYVNIRRYFLYLESSIDRGTQWAVFEPNGERLWANIEETISTFLYNEWVSGALLGDRPEQAFFVRCNRSTMTQNDLDNGRLICLIGVAAVKPAEFVIFRIGQKTADARS